MKTEKQIIEQRAGIYRQMQDLLNRSANENRPMSADESEQWNRMDSDFNALTAEMNAIQRMNGLATQMQPADEPVLPATSAPANAKREYFTRLFNSQPMDASMAMQRAVTSTTQNNGAYVVPEEFMRDIEVFLKAFGGMFQASYIHRSTRGGTMRWPTINDTAATGSWQAEPRSSGITPRAFSFDKKEYSAHLWTDVLALTYEFLQDEDVDFTSRVMAELVGTSFGRALNKALTDGNGSGKPTGILDASAGASTGKTTSSGTAITKAELIDLVHSVDPAYRTGPNVAFMFNDTTLAALKKLDFGTTDTVPLWMPSFREGEPDRVLGFRYVVNQDFPSIAATRKTVAFGDWSKYVVRLVQDFSLIRLNERYADELAVGFVAYARVDGKLLNNQAIKLLVQA
jgi:HK97 family phage major capsid protein